MITRSSLLSAASFRTAASLAGACVLMFVAMGCSKPLLAPTEERTPFDRYDNVRGRYAPQFVENEYGRREPNLRGRLGNKD